MRMPLPTRESSPNEERASLVGFSRSIPLTNAGVLRLPDLFAPASEASNSEGMTKTCQYQDSR